jgi:hypothetical protein
MLKLFGEAFKPSFAVMIFGFLNCLLAKFIVHVDCAITMYMIRIDVICFYADFLSYLVSVENNFSQIFYIEFSLWIEHSDIFICLCLWHLEHTQS